MGGEIVRRVGELKKQSEEEVKTEAEKEELGRRIGELEEQMERV